MTVVVVGGAGVSASAAMITLPRPQSSLSCKAAPQSPSRAFSANVFRSGRLPLESIQIQNLQNELATGKTLGIPSKQAICKYARYITKSKRGPRPRRHSLDS